jgi:hypothetical protein
MAVTAASCNPYALNFGDFLGALPSSSFSAPTFLPLEPQPCLFLDNMPQEDSKRANALLKRKNLTFFIMGRFLPKGLLFLA